MSVPRWLHPGIHIKRWLITLMVGLATFPLGIDYLLIDIYHFKKFPAWVAIATLQPVPRLIRALMFASIGVALIVVSLRRLNDVLSMALIPGRDDDVIDILYQRRRMSRGPKIVAMGGGTGLSIVLHGLKEYTGNLTAIVTVADDGGSSGRLRRELRILPPGDFRQCIAALADVEPLMAKLLQHRFKKGSGLEGHSFGNLFIAAMADITGNFEMALRESSRVLAVRGQILPSTLEDVTLAAELADQSTLHGESNLHGDGSGDRGAEPIERVFLLPGNAAGYPEAVQAILDADMIVVGPGSLYTSVLPNLLVKDIARAVSQSKALKVFVCNVATEPGETNGYQVRDFVAAVQRHVGSNLFHYVVTNSVTTAAKPSYWKSEVVAAQSDADLGIRVVTADVVDVENAVRHDSHKLAATLLRIYEHGIPSDAPSRRRHTAAHDPANDQITSVISIAKAQAQALDTPLAVGHSDVASASTHIGHGH